MHMFKLVYLQLSCRRRERALLHFIARLDKINNVSHRDLQDDCRGVANP